MTYITLSLIHSAEMKVRKSAEKMNPANIFNTNIRDQLNIFAINGKLKEHR